MQPGSVHNHYQGVYWPYRYQPYAQEQGSHWPYQYWPYPNNLPWQGSNWPYARQVGVPQQYVMPGGPETQMSPTISGAPLSNNERGELEMWRKLSQSPLEITFYGTEAFVKWANSAARIPVSRDGKIVIKLSPVKE
jgi:hypothetical protein